MYLNNYQSYTFGAIILGLLSFIACEKTTETSKIIGFGVRADLKQSESVWFGSDSLTGVRITVNEIADSRCPNDPNIQCVWAGEANVKLLATDTKDSVAIDLKLSPTNTFKIDTVNFILNSKTYKALLFEVNPYPTSSENKDVKSATLTVLNPSY